MKMISRVLLTTVLAFSFLAPSADAFTPYAGEYREKQSWWDYLKLKAGRPARIKLLKKIGLIKITSGNDPFKVQIRSRVNIRTNRRTFFMVLNPDGSGRINIRAISRRVGVKQSAPFALDRGDKVKFKTTGKGTWEITEGVKTKLKFRGKTNGIPTTITGFMDLTPEGDYILRLKAKYKKRNGLFSKPSVIRFGP